MRAFRKAVIAVLSLILSASVPIQGEYPTKSISLWELHKFKYTLLLQLEPLSWCPYKSYLMVDRYVEVRDKQNQNWLIVKANLTELVRSDADYNKAHASRYKGKPETKLRKIFRYCEQTEYVAHVKFARNVFESRQGDCAGISSAFYVLCKKNKIPVRYVIGWTKDYCHAWNRVKLNGKWYWIDATHGLWLSRKQFKGRTVMEMW